MPEMKTLNLTTRPGKVMIITLPPGVCGHEIKIYPGTENGHNLPVMEVPAETKLRYEHVDNGG